MNTSAVHTLSAASVLTAAGEGKDMMPPPESKATAKVAGTSGADIRSRGLNTTSARPGRGAPRPKVPASSAANAGAGPSRPFMPLLCLKAALKAIEKDVGANKGGNDPLDMVQGVFLWLAESLVKEDDKRVKQAMGINSMISSISKDQKACGRQCQAMMILYCMCRCMLMVAIVLEEGFKGKCTNQTQFLCWMQSCVYKTEMMLRQIQREDMRKFCRTTQHTDVLMSSLVVSLIQGYRNVPPTLIEVLVNPTVSQRQSAEERSSRLIRTIWLGAMGGGSSVEAISRDLSNAYGVNRNLIEHITIAARKCVRLCVPFKSTHQHARMQRLFSPMCLR